jgi:fructuronate reductase
LAARRRAVTTGRLSYAELPHIPRELRPRHDPRARRTGVVHLGVGAFHRAHQAFYTEQCGDWGICGFTQRSARVADQLAPQNGLYTLLVRDAEQVTAQVIGALREVRFAGAHPEAVAARIADPAITVLTLTVTEKGYRHDPATGLLRMDDPEIAADLAGRPPRTVAGQLAAGLAARARADSGPLTIVCCDNLPSNGPTLRGLVEQYAERFSHPRLPRGEALTSWIARSARFPATMIDRIVPATTGADRAEAAAMLGVRDEGTVVAEPDTHWVIENDFASPRPPWEKAGAVLVPDVSPYEIMKLRVVNGAHSSLAYLGGLAGHAYIADAAADADLAAFVRRLLAEDVAPTLDPPPGVDLAAYNERQLHRFANPALRHAVTQVAMDGSQKLPQRLLGTVHDRYKTGSEPVWAGLAVAAWMRHVATGRSDDGRPFPVDDPLATIFSKRLRGADRPRQVAAALLGIREVFGDLTDDAAFADLVTSHLERLTRDGARAAVRALAASA